MEEIHKKQHEALIVLIEAVKFAQSRGVYNFDQAALIATSIKTFQVEEQSQEKIPETLNK